MQRIVTFVMKLEGGFEFAVEGLDKQTNDLFKLVSGIEIIEIEDKLYPTGYGDDAKENGPRLTRRVVYK